LLKSILIIIFDARNKHISLMKEELIGREREQKNLRSYINTERSEFVAIYGRRRVGKTFLVRKTIGDKICFSLTGMENVGTTEQLTNFYLSLSNVYPQAALTKTWIEAFHQLRKYLETLNNGCKILFFDELPWLDTAKSDFVAALEHFWNSWASARNDIKLITCGSAASWMLDNLINNHGGLHNRITHQMLIEPFCLRECRQYFDLYGFGYSEKEIAECYMVLGGVPYYLSLMNKEESVAQNIDRLIFAQTGELRTEKANLFKSLFKHSDDYVKIIEALSSKNKGLTRNELLNITKLHNNAKFSKMLQELENCRFVRQYQPFDKKTRSITYQITDPFLYFCHKIQEKCNYQDENYWSHTINTSAYHAWTGFAFELLCLNHTSQIKEALRIGGIQTAIYCWRSISDSEDKGAQIDLIIDRADPSINLCEMKFSSSEFELTKSEREKIENRRDIFISKTKTRKSIRITMITSFGLKENIHSKIIQNSLSIKDLYC